MAQDCNMVLYNANYLQSGPSGSSAFFASQTAGTGTPLCNLTVAGGTGGGLRITDSTGKLVWTTVGLPLPAQDILAQGQSLAQGARLYSANGQYFLTLQSDDNLIICKYSHASAEITGCMRAVANICAHLADSSAGYAKYGASINSAIHGFGTLGISNNTPLHLQVVQVSK